MNKLTEQNLLKKSRFLKYSLLASISVGAIIAIPFEGMASSDQKALFSDALEKKLFSKPQSNGNKDRTNTPQQIGTVMVPEPERNTYTSSEIREIEISKQSKASNSLKDIPIEDHYKVVARSKSDVGKARKARPITRRKTFVGGEKTEQSQNTYTPEPTEQTPQKPEIMITESSPTVSPVSNGFVTVPNTPNTTLTSPEHYTTAPGTPSTPANPYQPTPDSKPNVGAKTPPNTNSKAVRRLSFSSEPQQTVQPSTQAKPPVPPKPLLLSSAGGAAKMVSNILRVNEMLGIKLAEVESTIKNTQGKKNKKPLQQLKKQIASSQKTTEKLKLKAAEIGIKIKALDEENRSLVDCNKKEGGVKKKDEWDKDKEKARKNNKKIDELQRELTNKNNEANELSEEIDISVNKVVLIKPQVKAPVTEMPSAGSFLNQQRRLEALTQQQKVNAARQAVVDKRRAEASEVKRNSAEYKDLISERQGTEREKKREEKARDIVGIRGDIAKKMQQISNASTTSNRLQELELKVGAIEDKKQRQEAQKQLSKIKKQKKAIKVAVDKAQKILNDAKKEASRIKLKKLQEQMDNHVAMVTNNKIEENIKKLEGLALTPSTTSSAATISKQSLTAKSTMQLSHELQRTLPEDEDGYLEPIEVQQQAHTVMLSNQEVADPKSMDSGFKSLEGQNLSSAYDFEQLSVGWDAAYNQRMNTKAENVPQETLTEESTYSVSSKKKQGNIIKGAVSKVGSILQTNDAKNRKRKRDGETSKQRTVDKEGGFGQGSGNEHHKEFILSVDSKLIEKAAQLISDLDVKRSEILQTTSPSQQKSLNLALQGIENDCQEAIEVYQGLQQALIRKPEDIKAHSAEAEKKLDAIKSRADKHFNNIEIDADVGFNPNWGNGYSLPTANMNSLPKNLAVTPPINVGSLYNSPQAQQFREDHKTTIINAINSLSSSGVPKESIDPIIIKSLPYLDNDQYQEVVLRVGRVHDINTQGYLLSKLKQLGELEVRELTGVYASLYNTAPAEVLREAEALLGRSQGRLNLVDSTIKGTQPLSNLYTIYEPVSYENLASETIYNREQPKPSISCKNTGKRKLARTPLFSAELDKKLDYLDLEDKLLKVEENRRVKEEQAIAIWNQYQDPENLEFKRLAIEALDLSLKESQLKEKRKAIEAAFSLNEGYSSTDVSSSRSYSVGGISDLLSDTELNLSPSPSINGLEDLSGSNVIKLERTLEEKKFYINKNRELFSELWCEDNYDPFLTDLGNRIFKGEQEIQKLEEEKKILEDKVTPNSLKDKPLRRSASASSLNIFGSNEDLSWDNTGDIGVGHRYGAEDSCPTLDQSSSKIANSSDKNLSETKLALLQTYQMAVIVKRQELEQLPSTSSGAAQIVQQIEVLREEEVTMHDAINACIADSSKLNDVSFEEINEALKKLGSGIPESAISDFESKAQKDPEAILDGSISQEMLSSKDSLPSGDEEQEDTEITESGIQKAEDKGLLALPVSSNECALALSDGREKECLALGDGSEDEESYDSGFEEEEEIIEQLSDSDGGNLKITEVDTAIPLEQKAKKEMQTQISENVPTLNQAKVVNTIVNNMIRNRLDASMNMSNNMVAVGAGDEEESRIKRGLWMRGMYGTNNHGRVENMTGYRGTNKGATIGFDVEIDNNILGIAYSNVHSVFKFKNSKNNDKELIDSHVVSIYGQKELPRNFALQALVSASKNFIKDKTTYSYGDTKIRSNVKHRNHSYNAEALLNYNYLLQNKLVITPNIGLRYGKSRDGVYNETGINVQEIALTMKENNILSGIVGTKVKVPLKDVLKFNNLGLTFQGAVEHNFKEKTQRINRVVKIFDTEFKQNYAILKQPKTSYNLGTGIIGSIKNTTISLDYNYYLNKHYRSHQGSVKLKVNL
ncbi:MAG: autotransporter domain-containing protein [Rickettsia endosymbiont of Sceptobius lativentris]|nr:autotransporter domain-containing protein [Rickettsia endosymbiont of Sceptobius lativentris]